MKTITNYHSLSVKEVFEQLKTNVKGLSKKEVKNRQEEFGYNKLPESKKFSAVALLIDQFKNPLIYILVVAMVIGFSTKHYTDGWIIFAVIMISTIVGFLQEFKANSALSHLKELIKYKANDPMFVYLIDNIKHKWGNVKVFNDACIKYRGDNNPTCDHTLFYPFDWKGWGEWLKQPTIDIDRHYSIHLFHTMFERNNMVDDIKSWISSNPNSLLSQVADVVL